MHKFESVKTACWFVLRLLDACKQPKKYLPVLKQSACRFKGLQLYAILFSLRHFGHLSHSSIKTRRNSIH